VTGKVVCHVGVQTQILGKLGKNLFHYRAKVRTEKAIFVALSYFRYDVARNCNVAEVRACVRAVLLAAEQRPRSCSLIRPVDRLARVQLLRYWSTLVASVGVHAMPRSIHERSHSALWGAHRPSAVRGVAQEASITVVGDGRGLKAPSTLMRLLTAVQGPLLVKVGGKEWREQGSWGGRVRSVGGNEDGREGRGGRPGGAHGLIGRHSGECVSRSGARQPV
jgi:hypothetical protein